MVPPPGSRSRSAPERLTARSLLLPPLPLLSRRATDVGPPLDRPAPVPPLLPPVVPTLVAARTALDAPLAAAGVGRLGTTHGSQTPVPPLVPPLYLSLRTPFRRTAETGEGPTLLETTEGRRKSLSRVEESERKRTRQRPTSREDKDDPSSWDR